MQHCSDCPQSLLHCIEGDSVSFPKTHAVRGEGSEGGVKNLSAVLLVYVFVV